MEVTYSFTINSSPSFHGTVRLPMTNNMVHFGQFRPDAILNKNFQHTAIVGVNHYETAAEFRNDCATIVNYTNAAISSSSIIQSLNNALKDIVESHVRRCGRIFINDLMAYIDTYSELLLALGMNRDTIKNTYPTILYVLIQDHSNYVLEAFNTPDGRNIQFLSSPRYTNLRNYIATKFPQLVR